MGAGSNDSAYSSTLGRSISHDRSRSSMEAFGILQAAAERYSNAEPYTRFRDRYFGHEKHRGTWHNVLDMGSACGGCP